MNRTVLTAGLLAVIVAASGYLWLDRYGPDAQPMLAASAQEAGSQTETAASAEASDEEAIEVVEMSMGDPDAPVTVIEYGSVTCSHCGRFHQEVFPQLQENYIDTGDVRFIFREVYQHRYGLWGGMVARCGGEMRYFGVIDRLMETQAEWLAGEPVDVAANLRRIGRSVGLNDEQLDACLTDNAMAEAMLAVSEEQTAADNVQGTPSFIINGEFYENMGYESFVEIIDGLLADEG